jgi:hypothetical protein
VIKSTKASLIDLKSNSRWLRTQWSSYMGILLSIFVTICLINPALSIAQNIVTQNDSTANCINLEAKAQSKAKWEYQPSKSYFTNETVKGSQFKINLDGHFPLGIRKPIEIHVTSSKPELIPSLAQTIYLSKRWLCALVSTGFVGIIYFSLARCVHLFYAHSEDGRAVRSKHHGWRILDPAVISASDYGAASLANLQILWFTLIVTWLLAYGWAGHGAPA